VEALPDGREFPRHPQKKVFDAVFLGAACQFPALHRIETELVRRRRMKSYRKRLGYIPCLPQACLPEAFPIKASDYKASDNPLTTNSI
jgi:hypothetical protein